jgi:nicotinamide-nucleotide amidase
VDEGTRLAVERVARVVASRGLTVAVAESLTCGLLANTLGAGPDASTWLVGGVVAYSTDVKRRVLGVRSQEVVTDQCAREMAEGVLALTGADLAISTTGVGGPGWEEDKPPGTVFVGTAWAGGAQAEQFAFAGDPLQVLEQTVRSAITSLDQMVTSQGLAGSPSGG